LASEFDILTESETKRGHAMPEDKIKEPLSETRRKEIFLALVDAQDQKMDVAQSRKLMVERFGITEKEVRQIERDGVDNQWPPLD
jgi:hypothetical protein